MDAYLILPEPAQWLIFPSGFGFKLKWVVNISSTGQKNYNLQRMSQNKVSPTPRATMTDFLRCYFLKRSLTCALYFNDQTAALGFSLGETVPEWGGAALCLQLNKYSSKFQRWLKENSCDVTSVSHTCTLAHCGGLVCGLWRGTVSGDLVDWAGNLNWLNRCGSGAGGGCEAEIPLSGTCGAVGTPPLND